MATVMEIRKEGSLWVGDLVFNAQEKWEGWQWARTLKALKENASQTFEGRMKRCAEKDR